MMGETKGKSPINKCNCGGTPVLNSVGNIGDPSSFSWVNCSDCGIETIRVGTDEEAFSLWNKSMPEHKMSNEIREVLEFFKEDIENIDPIDFYKVKELAEKLLKGE